MEHGTCFDGVRSVPPDAAADAAAHLYCHFSTPEHGIEAVDGKRWQSTIHENVNRELVCYRGSPMTELPQSCIDTLLSRLDHHGTSAAIVWAGRTISYRELVAAIRSWDARLRPPRTPAPRRGAGRG